MLSAAARRGRGRDGCGARPTSGRPRLSDAKIKKADDGSAPRLELTQNPDILPELRHRPARRRQVVVGFAAETGDAAGIGARPGRAKLARKGCDLLVVNDVSGGAVFGSADNEAVILAADGSATEVPRGSKAALAHVIWDRRWPPGRLPVIAEASASARVGQRPAPRASSSLDGATRSTP